MKSRLSVLSRFIAVVAVATIAAAQEPAPMRPDAASAKSIFSPCQIQAVTSSASDGSPSTPDQNAKKLRAALDRCKNTVGQDATASSTLQGVVSVPERVAASFDGSLGQSEMTFPVAVGGTRPREASRLKRFFSALRGDKLPPDELGVGAGEMLNNINSRLPGYLVSVDAVKKIGPVALRATFSRVGMSELAANSTFTTLTALRRRGRLTFGLGVVAKTVYDASVWWDPLQPGVTQQIGGHGNHYANDGKHFSKACSWCGVEFEAQYDFTRNFGLRATYIAVEKMSPTYNGTSLQFVYALKRSE